MVACLLFFARLRAPLLEPQEARYAEIPRQMLAQGRWLVPTLHGQDYLDKPPLVYWAVMLSYRAFGPCDWAARLVPGLAGVLTVLATLLWGWRAFGLRAGVCGAAVLCLLPEFVYRGAHARLRRPAGPVGRPPLWAAPGVPSPARGRPGAGGCWPACSAAWACSPKGRWPCCWSPGRSASCCCSTGAPPARPGRRPWPASPPPSPSPGRGTPPSCWPGPDSPATSSGGTTSCVSPRPSTMPGPGGPTCRSWPSA